MIDESMSGSRMESGRTRAIIKKEGGRRMDKEKKSGRVLVELREIRKVMEELLNMMRRVANGLKRREEAEQVIKRGRREHRGTGEQGGRREEGR